MCQYNSHQTILTANARVEMIVSSPELILNFYPLQYMFWQLQCSLLNYFYIEDLVSGVLHTANRTQRDISQQKYDSNNLIWPCRKKRYYRRQTDRNWRESKRERFLDSWPWSVHWSQVAGRVQRVGDWRMRAAESRPDWETRMTVAGISAGRNMLILLIMIRMKIIMLIMAIITMITMVVITITITMIIIIII